jgi:hypothetical protein
VTRADALEPYRDMDIAARDCQVIAASKSYHDLTGQLDGEDRETYIIVCLKPRIRFERGCKKAVKEK